MTAHRRRILQRYIATGNAKACGVNYSLLRRYVREACDELGCPETMLAAHLAPPTRRKRRPGVQLLDLGLS